MAKRTITIECETCDAVCSVQARTDVCIDFCPCCGAWLDEREDRDDESSDDDGETSYSMQDEFGEDV